MKKFKIFVAEIKNTIKVYENVFFLNNYINLFI